MARFLAWLRFAGAVVTVWFSIAATKAGCGGTSNPATRAVPKHRLWWIHRHVDKIDEARRRAASVHLLFVGDSITQNFELAGPESYRNFTPVWNDIFASHGAMNLGFNSDETGQMLWRLRHGEVDGLSPANVVLLAGANNLNAEGSNRHAQRPDQIASGILAVAAEIHTHLPAAHVVVLSILPSDLSAERSAKTAAVNALLRRRVPSLPYASYLDVTAPFLDGSRVRTELYLDPKLYAGGRALHPDPTGQRRMALLIAQALHGP